MSYSNFVLAGAALFAAADALAHGGHGAIGEIHWHATDTFGLLLVASLAAVAIWFGGRK